MAVQFQPLALLHSGSAALSQGRTAGAADAGSPAPVSIIPTADPLSPAVMVRFLELGPDLELVEVVLEIVGGGSAATDPKLLTARIGDTQWTVTRANGTTVYLGNANLQCIEQRSALDVGGLVVWQPVPACRFAGDTLTAISAAAPTSVKASYTAAGRLRNAIAGAMMGDFVDSAIDPTGRGLVESTLRAVQSRGGAGFPTQGNVGAIGAPPFPAEVVQQDAVVVDCVYAGVHPAGVIWCDAGDIGVSTTERVRIPADIASNNAASYRRYPSCFYRRPTYGRAVQQLGKFAGAITATGVVTGGALALFTTAVDLVASEWMIQIDGVMLRAVIHHNGVAGLRRPADIWNQVWVNIIAGGKPIELREVAAGFPFAGLVQRSEFLEYAGFVRAWENADPRLAFGTAVAQTGSTPVVGP